MTNPTKRGSIGPPDYAVQMLHAQLFNVNVYCPERPPGGTIGHPGVQLDTRVDSKKSFCRSVMEGTSAVRGNI